MTDEKLANFSFPKIVFRRGTTSQPICRRRRRPCCIRARVSRLAPPI